jgi:hypothetical protein
VISTGSPLNPSALLRDAVALFKSPRAFFRGLEKKGGYLRPVQTLAVWAVVSGVIGFLVGLLRPVPLGLVGGRAAQALGVVLGPLAALAVGFLIAGLLFVIWHLMGSKEDYQTSFRVWAFIAPVGAVGALLGIVPFLPLLTLAYLVYLLVVASQEVHGIPAARSWIVWGVLGALAAVFMAVALVVGAAAQSGRLSALTGPAAAQGRPF